MIKLFFKSILIGIANIIPGVSGGTVAVLLNMYDDLVNKIGSFLEVDFKRKVEYSKYLFIVLMGAGVGILLFANIIKFSIINYPKMTSLIFTLLILPSIPFVIKGLNYKKFKNIFAFICGAFIMIVFIFLDFKYNHSSGDLIAHTISYADNCFSRNYLIKLFICGVLSAGAMIIPGISGSLLLLMLGEYYNILAFISSFSIRPLFFLGMGVGVGLIVFSKIISILLEKHRDITLFFITGIISISVIQIWLNI